MRDGIAGPAGQQRLGGDDLERRALLRAGEQVDDAVDGDVARRAAALRGDVVEQLVAQEVEAVPRAGRRRGQEALDRGGRRRHFDEYASAVTCGPTAELLGGRVAAAATACSATPLGARPDGHPQHAGARVEPQVGRGRRRSATFGAVGTTGQHRGRAEVAGGERHVDRRALAGAASTTSSSTPLSGKSVEAAGVGAGQLPRAVLVDVEHARAPRAGEARAAPRPSNSTRSRACRQRDRLRLLRPVGRVERRLREQEPGVAERRRAATARPAIAAPPRSDRATSNSRRARRRCCVARLGAEEHRRSRRGSGRKANTPARTCSLSGWVMAASATSGIGQ